jgi:hypothetical protein
VKGDEMNVPSAKQLSEQLLPNTNHQKQHSQLVGDEISRMAIKLPTAFMTGILAKAAHSAKTTNNMCFSVEYI